MPAGACDQARRSAVVVCTGLMRMHPSVDLQPVCVGIDVDPEAHAIARPRLQALRQDRGVVYHAVQANFSDLPGLLGGLPGNLLDQGVDGALMDIGVSSMQLDTADRGFRCSSAAADDAFNAGRLVALQAVRKLHR